ncbi:MAG TPA: nitroreductase family protein [Immundisolibacter sp.]|nr:nitroreductase family protein [Immundisolibacter sp.]
MDAYATVIRYHESTKHRFEAYARGPETLDWDAQPAPFRRYDGAAVQALPLAAARFEAPFARLQQPVGGPPVKAGPESIGALLQLSFAISAWKSNGVERWALRCNPSSGNLHPVEAYLLAHGVAGIDDGVHHYRPEDHALERRADWPPRDGPPGLYLGLSSVIWREAWKYGERAFRYCQLDVGHAVAGVACAAALLGWQVEAVPGLATAALARLLGLDRHADFAAGRRDDVEREEPELLLALRGDAGAGAALPARAEGARWHGRASAIDPHPMYRWPIIDEVAAATAGAGDAPCAVATEAGAAPPLAPADGGPGAVATILGRRSGQRYDIGGLMPAAVFFRLLDATLARPQPPWQTLAAPGQIALLLFVHRVDGLAPGLYLLLRDAATAPSLLAQLGSEFAAAGPVAGVDHLDLRLLRAIAPAGLRRIARSLCCHQDIAATACFSLAMLAPFEPVLRRDPGQYRALLRQAGLIGQVLYLQAEALGYRGTGIGCYFDDELHALLGLKDRQWQSLYAFAIGVPLPDTRLETTAPYVGRPVAA